jgi:hypothetical protein
MDQFRFNLRYLTMPFPQSVLQLESGHRPILPGIVRVVELTRLGGMQTLQTVTAWLAAALAAAMLLREARRGLRGNALLQAAAVCVIGTLLAWNANVRMFIHPFEAVHVFYILFFVVAAAALALRACARSLPRLWIVSIASCVAATFTFGPGIASFAAPMSVAILRRQRLGTIALIGASAIATLFAYYLVLPGAAGLRGNVSASSAAVFFAVARLGAMYAEVVRLSVPELSMLVWIAWATGALAIALTATTVVTRWMRRQNFSDLETIGLAVFAFGFMANMLIAFGRTGYFFEYPGQLFAERYLFWSCVAWAGLILYALARLADGRPASRYGAAAAVGVLSVCAIPSAVWANDWAGEVHRLSELTAVAERLTIRNDADLAAISDEGPMAAGLALDEMRRQRVAMFAERPAMRLGDKVALAKPEAILRGKMTNVTISGNAGKTVRLLSGKLSEQLASHAQSSELWLVGGDGTLIGRGAITYGLSPNRLRLGEPKWVGFQGYVLRSDSTGIVLAAVADGVATPLARVELRQ